MAEMVVKWDQALEVGAHAFVGGDAVNLRSAPALDGPVLVELDLGAPVDVLQVGADATVGARTAPWVRVKAGDREGWLFGGILTSARVQGDLDGDGKDEVAVLAFRTDRHQVLRLKEAGGTVQELDLGDNSDISGPADEIHLDTTPASEAGIALLRAYWPGHEMCGSGTRTWWVSWVNDRLRVAISGSNWSDAPVWDSVEVKFHPATRTATSVHESSDDGEKTTRVVKELELKDGVFAPIKKR